MPIPSVFPELGQFIPTRVQLQFAARAGTRAGRGGVETSGQIVDVQSFIPS